MINTTNKVEQIIEMVLIKRLGVTFASKERVIKLAKGISLRNPYFAEEIEKAIEGYEISLGRRVNPE